MVLRFLKKLFGTAQERRLAKFGAILDSIHECERSLRAIDDIELKKLPNALRERLRTGATLNEILPEAYAVLREACRRLKGTRFRVMDQELIWDMVPFDVQLLGGIAMHFGHVAEMQTGEGKTLTACLPLYLNALSGQPVHLVTVNDYLAERDCQWNEVLFSFLGVTVGAITQSTPPSARGAIYQRQIVYATASEFGFDYLRDNATAHSREEQVQRGFGFAIVDEIDSILIDEARTPLIISGPAATSSHMYDALQDRVAAIVRQQRAHCDQLAKAAWEHLMRLGFSDVHFDQKGRKWTKEEQQVRKEACRNLWLVSKGLPKHPLLQRAQEMPALRSDLDQLDLQLYSESGKRERAELLASLLVLVDERNSEYELTDKGVAEWHSAKTPKVSKVHSFSTEQTSQLALTGETHDDFVMLDLGHEYHLIDGEPLDDAQKMERKLALQAEDGRRKERIHNLRQLLRAHLLMDRDVDYIVFEDKIVIIDENTGRPQPGRRYADGLHQALEAKECVTIQRETQTYASITLQNYFRMYDKLSGMSGTAITEAQEFKEIYRLDVLQIPTHLPCLRHDAQDEVYMTEREKYKSLLAHVEKVHKEGRPILIGTESVDASEKLSRLCHEHHLPHTVLNAKQHDKEAQVISLAGQRGAITISTNMAGRGTDIRLGASIAEIGGLHVIGATRHQSRRIDRQLRGRCARQGDPGSSQFYVSFEDQLIRLFASPKMAALLHRFRPPEGEPISSPLLSRSIETAQKRVEQRNYTVRKHTLEFDDVMNVQRREVYSLRNDIMQTHAIVDLAEQLMQGAISMAIEEIFTNGDRVNEDGLDALLQWTLTHFPLSFEREQLAAHVKVADLHSALWQAIGSVFRHKLASECERLEQLGLSATLLEDAMRTLMLRRVDQMWQEHLLAMDHLRTEVHLRTLGQKDPLLEYKEQAFELFAELSIHLREKISRDLFSFEIIARGEEPPSPDRGNSGNEMLFTSNR